MGQSSRSSTSRKGSSNNTNHDKKRADKKENKKRQPKTTTTTPRRGKIEEEEKNRHETQLDLSNTTPLPISLQQLLLNIFKSALLFDSSSSSSLEETNPDKGIETGTGTGNESKQQQLNIKSLIQTIKSHLYNRDFDSAFTDANDDLLRAYALRWSASRALGYAHVFKGVLGDRLLGLGVAGHSHQDGVCCGSSTTPDAAAATNQIVCVGGGAGAEIVALAGVWRDFLSSFSSSSSRKRDGQDGDGGDVDAVSNGVSAVSLQETTRDEDTHTATTTYPPNLSIKAIDIADWSAVVDRLSTSIKSPAVPSSKSHPAPLLPLSSNERGLDFTVDFTRADVLGLDDDELGRLFHGDSDSDSDSDSGSGSGSEIERHRRQIKKTKTIMVTLMFTLNELFSTSMAKTTAFLLRTTDQLEPGTLLLVLDSPGSYSTLTLGGKSNKSENTGNKSEQTGDPSSKQQRNYPMKFLLDHTLLSVARGKWEKVFSEDSRWWRRDAAKLRYEVGEGVGLEDMRFQVHVYRRLDS